MLQQSVDNLKDDRHARYVTLKCGQRTPLSERVISEHESEDVLKCHQEIDLRNAIFQITGVNWLKVEEGLKNIKRY